MLNSCIPEASIEDFAQRLRFNKANERVPLVGVFEPTFRCNNRCVHCYANKGANDRRERKRELTYSHICRILDEIAEEGCLWLLFTGGEPFVREDFLKIYTYAKRKGFLITLFTNGTLVDHAVADFLREWPPRSIEITLYGMTEGVYEEVTRARGSYAKCMQGIELLVERNLPLKLKSVVLTLNRHELNEMKAFAENLGLEFLFDPLLNLRIDGRGNPAKLRLSPREVVQLDLDDETRRMELVELYGRFGRTEKDSELLFRCGAGIHSFHIDPYGLLHICGMVRHPGYDLINGCFRDGWHRFLPGVRAQARKKDNPCADCNLDVLCGQCPGWSHLEYGDLEKPVEYLCQVGRLRAELLPWENEYKEPTHTEVEG
jgi:radical SAM protein with 4Fe4S-binding SPASM domain